MSDGCVFCHQQGTVRMGHYSIDHVLLNITLLFSNVSSAWSANELLIATKNSYRLLAVRWNAAQPGGQNNGNQRAKIFFVFFLQMGLV